MNIRKIIIYILTVIQISLFSLVLVLENLYPKKMGVARYIQFKNIKLSETFFSDTTLNIYSIVFIISLILGIGLIYNFFKKKSKVFLLMIFISMLISSLGLYLTFFGNIDNIKFLYFFILATLISLVIQYIKILIKKPLGNLT